MSNSSADSPAVPPPVEGWLAGPKPPSEGWTQNKFFFVLILVLALHVALIFLLSSKKHIVPRAVTNIPHLQLADSANELIELSDPTLFARPNAHDLVTAFWRHIPAVSQPNFTWTEDPRYLPPAPQDFGVGLREYVRNSEATEFPLNFKPQPKLVTPDVAYNAPVPQTTTMQISGELAQRRLLNTIELPSPPYNDVIDASKVQVLVDTTGNVFSSVLLESCGVSDIDQRAVQLAGTLRFAPAPQLMLGEITFTWHTVPTNTVPATAP
jgi:hypothetical protein